MWSTSSVVIRGSCRYCLISFVYSSSFRCGDWTAAPRWVCAGDETTNTPTITIEKEKCCQSKVIAMQGFA